MSELLAFFGRCGKDLIRKAGGRGLPGIRYPAYAIRYFVMAEATTGNGDGSGVAAAVSVAVAEPPREKLTKKAITADHPTWCPGCGDFAVLAAFYKILEKRNLEHEKIVTLAGIG